MAQAFEILYLVKQGAKASAAIVFTVVSQNVQLSAAEESKALTKWLTFCRQHFQMHFCEWKFYGYLHLNIGSNDGLLPSSNQQIMVSHQQAK